MNRRRNEVNRRSPWQRALDLGVVAVAALGVIALVSSSCGGSGQQEALDLPTTTEFKPSNKPFKLAEPTTTVGLTPIPDFGPTLPGTPEPPPDIESTTTITAPPPTTTTTTLPIVIKRPKSSDLICEGFYYVASAIRYGQNRYRDSVVRPGSVTFAKVRDEIQAQLTNAADVLATASQDPALAEIAAGFSARLSGVQFVLSQSTSFEQGGTFLYPLILDPGQPGDKVTWPTIEAHLDQNCPELIRAMTGKETMNRL